MDTIITFFKKFFVPQAVQSTHAPISPQVGWYAFENGCFSPFPDAYPHLIGVVCWVNPDENARDGNKGFILSPDEIKKPWATNRIALGIDLTEDDGQKISAKLINFAHKHWIIFRCPAFRWCARHIKHGYQKGKGFLASKEQWKKVLKNYSVIYPALLKIKATPLNREKNYWTASEFSHDSALTINMSGNALEPKCKDRAFFVRCFFAF